MRQQVRRNQHVPVPRWRRPSPARSPTGLSSSTRSARCCRARPLDARRRRSPGSGPTAVDRSSPCRDLSNRSATGRWGSWRLRTPRTMTRFTRASVFAVGPPTTSVLSSANWFESEPVSSSSHSVIYHVTTREYGVGGNTFCLSTFESLDLESSFLVCGCVFRIFRFNSYIKVIGQGQDHRSNKSVSVCRKPLQSEEGKSWQSLSYRFTSGRRLRLKDSPALFSFFVTPVNAVRLSQVLVLDDTEHQISFTTYLCIVYTSLFTTTGSK